MKPLEKLSARGQSVWIDSLSREMLETGALQKLVDEDSVVGVTSNPSIFQKALEGAGWYDEQLKELASEEDLNEVFIELASRDIEHACDVMAPVFDRSGGTDGFVSMEVDPTLAHDTQATLDQALRFHAAIDRPNLYVKIPATQEGLPAIEECIAQGKSINVTLIFSLERYAAVLEAYVRGVERLREGGGDITKVRSVASFFVSRVDTEADKRLDAIGTEDALSARGELAIANAKLAYEHFQQVSASERWQELEAAGAKPQRCLWASTSTKNPAYRDVIYVEELIGPETVNTMPLETVKAFQDHGEVRGDTILEDVEGAHDLLDHLADLGVDYDDLVQVLEDEGVQKFSDAYASLIDGIRTRRGATVGA
jgi:transaldolase